MYPSVIGPSKRFAPVIGPSKRFTPTLEDVVTGLGQVLLLGARRRGGGGRLGKPETLNPTCMYCIYDIYVYIYRYIYIYYEYIYI